MCDLVCLRVHADKYKKSVISFLNYNCNSMERGPYAISCVISGAPSACRVIADRYRKYLHVTVRLKLRLDGRSAICHIHNTRAIPTRNMPYPQEICHVHKKYAISTRNMPCPQDRCHIYKTDATSTTLMPYLQHICHHDDIFKTYAISATLALSSTCDLRVQVSQDER